MEKLIISLVTLAASILFTMLFLYFGWNEGFVPALSGVAKPIDFWDTFFLTLFFGGASTPITMAIKQTKSKS